MMYKQQWHLHIEISLPPCTQIIIVSPRPSYSHSLNDASPISQAFLDNTFLDRIIARLQCLRRLGDIRNQLAETFCDTRTTPCRGAYQSVSRSILPQTTHGKVVPILSENNVTVS